MKVITLGFKGEFRTEALKLYENIKSSGSYIAGFIILKYDSLELIEVNSDYILFSYKRETYKVKQDWLLEYGGFGYKKEC